MLYLKKVGSAISYVPVGLFDLIVTGALGDAQCLVVVLSHFRAKSKQ